MKEQLHIIKIGGNVIDDALLCENFVRDFAQLPGLKLLVHGGGKMATDVANSLGVKQTIIDGRRVTDAETLKIAVMVYAGLINKKLVAGLQARDCNAAGFSGADGNLVNCEKRKPSDIDFGFVGDLLPDSVNDKFVLNLLNAGVIPVICPITHDGEGNLLNTNADTLATALAMKLRSYFNISLTFCFEKKGVLENPENEESYFKTLQFSGYKKLKQKGIVSKGMIPKLDNAFKALEHGVDHVLIGHSSCIKTITRKIEGTQLQLV